ncbi:MAG: glutathione S-transferase family protein [Pseudomonadota bacterium]
MQLHESNPAPNSRRVHIFMDEKDVEISRVNVDLRAGENLTPEFKAMNPMGRIPVLELDNGRFIAESVAICRYLEELHPSPRLFGNTPESKATIEMWNRRAENNFMMSVAMAFRNISGIFKDREEISAEWGAISARVAADLVPVFDEQLSRNEFLAGDEFSIADITFLVAYEFAGRVQVEVPELPNIDRWLADMKTRSSYSAR